jgi:uncharacterized membrane protein YfcA
MTPVEPLMAVLAVVFAAGLVQGLAGFGSALVAAMRVVMVAPAPPPPARTGSRMGKGA